MSNKELSGQNSPRPDVDLTVERMTPVKKELAEMILTTEISGKLVRRFGEGPGSWDYEAEEGRFPMLTISKNEHEFAGQANLKDPQNPNEPLLLYFLNLRGGTEENYRLMARSILDKGIPFHYDYVLGIPSTGPKIGKPLAEITGKPYIELLEKAPEGSKQKFTIKDFDEGDRKPKIGEMGLIVDDLITKKTTKDQAESVISKAGFGIAGHAVVVDREEGGLEDMRLEGRVLIAAITATELFAYAYQKGEANEETYDMVMFNIKKHKAESAQKRREKIFQSRVHLNRG